MHAFIARNFIEELNIGGGKSACPGFYVADFHIFRIRDGVSLHIAWKQTVGPKDGRILMTSPIR